MRLINCNGRYCNYIFGNPRVSQQIAVWWQLFHHLPFSQIAEQMTSSDIEVRNPLRRPRRNSESAKDGAGTVYTTNMG